MYHKIAYEMEAGKDGGGAVASYNDPSIYFFSFLNCSLSNQPEFVEAGGHFSKAAKRNIYYSEQQQEPLPFSVDIFKFAVLLIPLDISKASQNDFICDVGSC